MTQPEQREPIKVEPSAESMLAVVRGQLATALQNGAQRELDLLDELAVVRAALVETHERAEYLTEVLAEERASAETRIGGLTEEVGILRTRLDEHALARLDESIVVTGPVESPGDSAP